MLDRDSIKAGNFSLFLTKSKISCVIKEITIMLQGYFESFGVQFDTNYSNEIDKTYSFDSDRVIQVLLYLSMQSL